MVLVRGRDGGLDLERVHRVGHRVHVDEDGPCSGVDHGGDGGDEGTGDGDDLTARSDAGGEQRQVKRAGSAVDGHGVADSTEGGELLFKGGNFAAENELSGLEDACHGGQDLVFDVQVLLFQINEWN
jgi:hypothetical protein